MKILLVDPSQASRNIARCVLAQLGYTDIEEAGDGHEALDRLERLTPDLVLVDRHLPNLDGLTFVKTLRQNDPDTPVIMITTENKRSKVIEAIQAGVTSYLVKPLAPDLLRQRIVEATQKAAAA